MATFFNTATLTYDGNVVNSNTTEAELLSGLTLTKTALSSSYSAGGNVVYAATLTNTGTTPYTALTLIDNLGAYPLPEGGVAVPLSYVAGSVRYYLNGEEQTPPATSGTGDLEISGIDVPAGSTVTLIYEARTNEFAPLADGSIITNVASVDGGAGIGVITASATVPTEETRQLTIAKAVCPATVTDNGTLTYTIIVQNLGNLPVLATDGVIISDTFNPVLSNITVTLDGAALAEGTGYTYNEATGEFATTDGTVTVPAAVYTQDPVSGTVTTTPGVAVLTVSGTV